MVVTRVELKYIACILDDNTFDVHTETFILSETHKTLYVSWQLREHSAFLIAKLVHILWKSPEKFTMKCKHEYNHIWVSLQTLRSTSSIFDTIYISSFVA